MILTGGSKNTGRETCHSATLSTTNLTSTDLGLNTGFRGESPATDRLSWHDPYLLTIQYSNPIPTSQRTRSVSIMRAKLSILYREIITVYFKKHLLNVNRPKQFVAEYRVFRKEIQYENDDTL